MDRQVKLVGVLGGTSWPSTILAYRKLNELISSELGGHHSARILLYSIDYHSIKSRYGQAWNEVPALLKTEIARLLAMRPDCWMIANNALHKAFDEIANQVREPVPFFHAVELVREHLIQHNISRAVLLGTRFTMEDGFFAAPLIEAGVTIEVPDARDRERIQEIQTRLASGELSPEFRTYFRSLLARYEGLGFEAVITACTELPLTVDQQLTSMRVIDPLDLQVRACVRFALD
jgi:aspartate racemase